jgi:hypothetical protein
MRQADMKPFYTVDAGEFLVGSMIEKELPGTSLWFPAKDEGDDLLLLNRGSKAFSTVQIKVSRDYLVTHMDDFFHPRLECCGWFTPKRSKIADSISDFWILGLHSYGHQRLSVVVIEPAELLRRYDLIHGNMERLQSYFWLTKAGKVYETRGLSKDDQRRIAEDRFDGASERDFTRFLNNWSALKGKLRAEQPH